MPFGEQAYLGMVSEGSSATYRMEFTADDALKRIFKSVAMSGTNEFVTDLLKLSGFNYDGMRQYITGYGNIPEYVTNKRWNVNHLDVSFNPDNWSGGTGKTLPDEFIKAVKDAILKIVADSDGFIKSYSFSNANNPIDNTIPPDGNIWVHRYSNINGMGTAEYPTAGDQIKSVDILINPEKTAIETVYWDVYNAFLQGVNDIVVTPNARNYVDNWYNFLFKRAINTKFYSDREEHDSFSGIINPLAKDVVRLTQDRVPDIDIIPRFGGREEKYRKSETHIPIDKTEYENPKPRKITK